MVGVPGCRRPGRGLGRERVHALRALDDLPGFRAARERGQEVPADVTLGERIEVAALQGEILDDRPVKRPAFFAKDLQGRR